MSQLSSARLGKQVRRAPLGLQFAPSQEFAKPRPKPSGRRPTSVQEVIEQREARGFSKSPSTGVGGGLLGAVLNNPVVSTAIKPLQALDYPRRLVMSSVNELADAFNGGDTSWSDFTSQIGDETFGFGDVVGDTGNKWLDRGIGFLGDVVLDPVTYATLGAGKFAGGAGRAAAAAKVIAEGGDVADAAKIGKLGLSSGSQASRDLLGAGKAGIHLGTRNHNVRVPGTELLARGVGTGLGATRAAVGNSRLGGAVRKLRNPDEVADAMRVLHGNAEGDVTKAAMTIRGTDAARVGSGTFKNELRQEATQWDKTRHSERVALTHAAEKGEAGPIREFFDTLRQKAADAGVTGYKYRENYVQHVATKQFADLLSGDEAAEAAFRVGNTTSTGRGLERAFEPGGTYTYRGRTETLDDASIADVNEKIGGMLGFKVFEDDIAKIAHHAVNSVAEDVGRVTALHELKANFPEYVTDIDSAPTKLRPDWDATNRVIEGETRARSAAVNATRAEARGAKAEYRSTVQEAKASLDSHLRETQEHLAEMGVRPDLDDAEDALSASLTIRGVSPYQDPSSDLVRAARAASQDRGIVRGTRTSGSAAELDEAADELQQVVAQYAATGDPEIARIGQLLADARVMRNEIEGYELWTLPRERAWRDLAKAGKVAPVMEEILEDGWKQVGKGLLDDADGLAVRIEAEQALARLTTVIRKNSWLKAFDEMTSLFKTYATMTPGFHFRNAMSATFMNYADGVGTADIVRAARLWKQFRADPLEFLSTQPADVQDAFRATFGSGAGGFDAAELGQQVNRAASNRVTRASRKAGEWVEGPARLALALDTMKRGGDVHEAVTRITRIHFDYSQLSGADRAMKRVIPFWTFMSRNFPLQLQQQWLKPKSYAHYQSLVRNLDQGQEGDIMPVKWAEQGAFKVGNLGDDPFYLAPDLPHIRLQQEAEKFANPARLLSEANPIARVPYELFADEKLYSGRPFYPGENKALYAALSTIPLLSQGDRLTGGGVTGAFTGGERPEYAQQKQLQSILSYMGIPARQLTPSALEAELRRRQRDGT